VKQHQAVALHIARKHNNLKRVKGLFDLANQEAQILTANTALHKDKRGRVSGQNVAKLAKHHAWVRNGGKNALRCKPHLFGEGKAQLRAKGLVIAHCQNVSILFRNVINDSVLV